ncbi:MAG: two component transcriptional regulator, LytTR family [Bacteroidetes bacterium]|nr:two component transcriptional regulator, LytTR family [Bacteroidota bacterium]
MTARIKTILVDDEKDSREVLSKLIGNYFPDIGILGEASNVEEASRLIEQVKPQLVFLDIQMPRASGFNLLQKYEEVPFEVIFVTSYDQYAITAIKFNALDYILKPVEITDLRSAIKKATHNIEKKIDTNSRIVNLLHSLDTDVKDRKFAVHSGEKVKMLSVQNVVCIEADGRYCHLSMNNRENYTTSKYLKEFEDYLEHDPAFIRVSKSLMINVNYIKEYSKGEYCIIEMENGKSVEVARRKKQEVLERLKEIK